MAILSYEETGKAVVDFAEDLDDRVLGKMRVIISVAGYFILVSLSIFVILPIASCRCTRAVAEVTSEAVDSIFKRTGARE